MARKIVVTSGKGGVGKTTVAANLGAQLSKRGQRVILCDTDFGLNNMDVVTGVENLVVYDIVDVIEGRCRAKQALVRHPDFGNLYILASNHSAPERYISPQAVKLVLDTLSPQFDFIFIDCPPSLELLTLNALCAADAILVPVQGEYFALEGLSDLMNTVRIVRRSLNPKLELEGVLLTMFDGRTNLALQVAEEVKHYFPGKVYATVIPRNVRLSEAPSHGKPITAYDRSSRGAEAYTALAAEFLKKQNKQSA